MNKKSLKTVLGVTTVVGAAFILTSCNSFCSNLDTSNYMFGYNGMNTVYFAVGEEGNEYAQGEQYILDTFKAQANVDATKVTLDKLMIDAGTTNPNDNQKYITTGENNETVKNTSLFFNQINENLYSIKNVEIYCDGISTAEEGDKGVHYVFGLNDFTKNLLTSASSYRMITPSSSYWEALDNKVLDAMISEAKNTGIEALAGVTKETLTYEQLYGYTPEQLAKYKENSDEALLNEMLEGKEGENIGRNNALLARAGHIKFYNEANPTDYFANLNKWNDEIIKTEGFNFDDGMSQNFLNLMKTNLTAQVQNLRTCITVNDGFYGHVSNDPLNDTVLIEGKGEDFYEGWGRAFSEHGFLEGLLVYPIGTMVENFAHIFGMNGAGQIFAVLLATLIIRVLFLLVTMPSTLSQQKMTFLQPELAKLQQKYPNANTNNYEKQKLASAQMALYKKYKVHPFASLLVIVVQFPVFICVWNALQGSASLSRDAVLGLRLSDTIWNVLSNFTNWPSNPGWWTALVLVLLMSAAQIVAMLLPNWLNKKRMKSITKLGNSATMSQQNKTLKITQWVMTIFIIIMGFTLPSAMGVYWFAGAIISILQSVLLHFIFIKRAKNHDRNNNGEKVSFSAKIKNLFKKKEKEGTI